MKINIYAVLYTDTENYQCRHIDDIEWPHDIIPRVDEEIYIDAYVKNDQFITSLEEDSLCKVKKVLYGLGGPSIHIDISNGFLFGKDGIEE